MYVHVHISACVCASNTHRHTHTLARAYINTYIYCMQSIRMQCTPHIDCIIFTMYICIIDTCTHTSLCVYMHM